MNARAEARHFADDREFAAVVAQHIRDHNPDGRLRFGSLIDGLRAAGYSAGDRRIKDVCKRGLLGLYLVQQSPRNIVIGAALLDCKPKAVASAVNGQANGHLPAPVAVPSPAEEPRIEAMGRQGWVWVGNALGHLARSLPEGQRATVTLELVGGKS